MKNVGAILATLRARGVDATSVRERAGTLEAVHADGRKITLDPAEFPDAGQRRDELAALAVTLDLLLRGRGQDVPAWARDVLASIAGKAAP